MGFRTSRDAPIMVDRDKLQALRNKYGSTADAPPGKRVIFNPEYKRIVDAMSGALPYANPATLLSLPFRPAAEPGALDGLDVGVIGVPFDLGVTNRPGTRFGPRAVRAVDRVGPFEPV